MAIRAIRSPSGSIGFRRPDLGRHARARRRRRLPPSRPANEDWVKRVIGLPGDTDRGARRRRDPERPGDPAPARSTTFDLPVSPNSPCRIVERRRRAPVEARAADDGAALPLSRASARRCRAGAATRCSTRAAGRADNFGPSHRAGGPALHDGRQSRRQRRQPLRRLDENGVGLLPIDNVLGRGLDRLLVDRRLGANGCKPWTWFTRRALEPDLRDGLLMSDARGLAGGDARPQAGQPRLVRTRR